MLTAIVADYFESRGSVVSQNCLLGSAFRTPLRCHHISLVENLLILFREKKYLLALDTRNFDVRHIVISFGAVLALAKSNTLALSA